MLKYPQNLKRAFSLIEVLIATALTAILLAAIAGSFIPLINNTRVNDTTVRARQAGNRTLEYIITHVRRAKEITLTDATGQPNSFTTLVTLDVAERGTNGQWGPTAQGEPMQWTRFTLVGNELRVVKMTGATQTVTANQPILRDVGALVFRSQRSEPNNLFRNVTIEMTIEVEDAFHSPTHIIPFTIAGVASVRSLGH